MVEKSDLIKHLVDKKPTEFATAWDELLKAKISQAVSDKKVELSSNLFGAPEGQETEEPVDAPDSETQETETSSDQESNS